jgi:isoleucyl-tRNA synthetase
MRCCVLQVLLSLCRLMAPFTPFFTETLYQGLRRHHPSCNDETLPEDAVGRAKSVHFLSIPEVDASAVDHATVECVANLQVCMAVVRPLLPLTPMAWIDGGHVLWLCCCRCRCVYQAVVEAGRAVRLTRDISMKTPVSEVVVVSTHPKVLEYSRQLESYIKEVRLRRVGAVGRVGPRACSVVATVAVLALQELNTQTLVFTDDDAKWSCSLSTIYNAAVCGVASPCVSRRG